MKTTPIFLVCLVAIGTGCLFTPSLAVCPTGDVGEGSSDTLSVVSSGPTNADVAVEVDTEESNKGTGGKNKGLGDGDGGRRRRRNEPDVVEDAGEDAGESGSGSEDTARRVSIKVHGQSGKFSIFDADADSPSCDPNTITVTMDALRELDADGNAVGTSGSIKHSINTFAPQEFEISPPEDVEIGSASAAKISFSTPFKGLEESRLTIDTYSITRPGDVGTDLETWAVRNGDVKFNLALSNWHWCGYWAECSNGQMSQVGAFIDVVISVKGSQEAKASSDGKFVELGGGASIELSDRVFVDGEWTAMPEGYPMVSIQGTSTMFTFRFPKFSASALYDPVVSSGDVEPLLTEDEPDAVPPVGGDGTEKGEDVDVNLSGAHLGNRPLNVIVAMAMAMAYVGAPWL